MHKSRLGNLVIDCKSSNLASEAKFKLWCSLSVTSSIETEVKRLEKLGAKIVEKKESWVVMQAPSGHRFCVGKPYRGGFETNANKWPEA